MRIIKFRVWVGRHDGGGTMINEPTVGETGADFVEINNMFKTGKNTEYGGGFTTKTPNWMQFTGLKDKNGKEIYEGDIVQTKNKFDKVVQEREITFGELVDYNEGYKIKVGIGFNIHNKDKGCFEYTEEVIGNIYENPNLLKK